MLLTWFPSPSTPGEAELRPRSPGRPASAAPSQGAAGTDTVLAATRESDVLDAMALARQRRLTLEAVAGPDDDLPSVTSVPTLRLDVSRLADLHVDAQGLRATVGPGCTSSAWMAALSRERVFVPAGHAEDSTLAAHLRAGGRGWYARQLGAAGELLLGVDVVTANGAPIHATAHAHVELFWAARRGLPLPGGGVITRYHLRLQPLPPVMAVTAAVYPLTQLEPVLRWAQTAVASGPDTLDLTVHVSRCLPITGAAGVLVLAPVFAPTWAAARRAGSIMSSRPRGASLHFPWAPLHPSWLHRALYRRPSPQRALATGHVHTHLPADAWLPWVQQAVRDMPTGPSRVVWRASHPGLGHPTHLSLHGVTEGVQGPTPATAWARRNTALWQDLATPSGPAGP